MDIKARSAIIALSHFEGDICRDARIVLGGVAPIPWRARSAEEASSAAREAAELSAGRAMKKVEESLSKAEEALLTTAEAKKTPLSWQMITIIILAVLSSIFAAVAVSLGLGLGILS